MQSRGKTRTHGFSIIACCLISEVEDDLNFRVFFYNETCWIGSVMAWPFLLIEVGKQWAIMSLSFNFLLSRMLLMGRMSWANQNFLLGCFL